MNPHDIPDDGHAHTNILGAAAQAAWRLAAWTGLRRRSHRATRRRGLEAILAAHPESGPRECEENSAQVVALHP